MRSTLSTSFTDCVLPGELCLYLAWDFLPLVDRYAACRALRVLSPAIHLRSQAYAFTTADWATVSTPMDNNTAATRPLIDPDRITHLTQWFCLCGFDVGTFVRSLGGHYTGDFIDLAEIDLALSVLENTTPSTDNPSINFDNAKFVLHHGFPRVADFHCRQLHSKERNLYNNHSTIDEHQDLIREKITTDVNKSYAIALPRWIQHFIIGLILNSLGIVFRKNKSRMVNDPSNAICPHDTSCLNDQFDKKNPEQVPPVSYGTTMKRFIFRLWNLRISHPTEPICLYKDDLLSAFRRIRYMPEVIPAFAYIFQELLLLPIGGLFGPRNTPGWFSNLSDLRAFASQHLASAHTSELTDLISRVTMATHPSTPPAAAKADDLNPGAPPGIGAQSCFVNDTLLVELASDIPIAANASTLTANIFFGSHQLLEEPISREKFEQEFAIAMNMLGLDFDTHAMTCAYPIPKRTELLRLLQAITWTGRHPTSSLLHLASIQGNIRNVGHILLVGSYLSLRLHFLLSAVLRARCHKINFKKAT